MWMPWAWVGATVLALCACGKSDAKKPPAEGTPAPLVSPRTDVVIAPSTTQSMDSCPPLSVTLEGKPLELPHGLAKTVYGTPSIALYADPVECDAFMKNEISTYPVAHIAVGIGVNKKGRISVGSSRGGTALVNRITPDPKKPKVMALCVVNPVVFTPLHSKMSGTLRVHGLVQGTHCGDIKRSDPK